MIVILKQQAKQEQIDSLKAYLTRFGLRIDESRGEKYSLLGLVGDTSCLDAEVLASMDAVQSVRRVQAPLMKVSRDVHPADSVIDCGGVRFGGGVFQIIAGPCSVENEEQIVTVAKAVQKAGATMLRGGAFKPRTSPYAFQGLHGDGLRLLKLAKQETGLPIVTEIMDASHLDMFEDVDLIQVGARNMQNFELLKVLGRTNKPILLKRGLANTIQEWLMSAEYIMAGGNDKVILCERGIRTFETATRNTLDLSCVPLLKEKTHLPVMIDPSHAVGMAKLVAPLALAGAACGADGLMIEVHNDPKYALSDGAQAITPQQFAELVQKVQAVREAIKG